MLNKEKISIQKVLIKKKNIPVLRETSLLKEALECMSKYKYGVCFCVNEKGKLLGILTDGDVRRKILDVQKPFSALLMDDLILHINKKPFSIDVNKIQKLVKTTKLTGELLSDFLRSSAVKTPEIIIRIGRCSLLISAHMLLAMIDLMMRCSKTFIMFKDSLLGLAGFTDKYSPQLFYVFYSLFVSFLLVVYLK